jgi:hypothetical protein
MTAFQLWLFAPALVTSISHEFGLWPGSLSFSRSSPLSVLSPPAIAWPCGHVTVEVSTKPPGVVIVGPNAMWNVRGVPAAPVCPGGPAVLSRRWDRMGPASRPGPAALADHAWTSSSFSCASWSNCRWPAT